VRALLETMLAEGAPLRSLLRAGLTGLTDDEYWWEPVAGCWSIRDGVLEIEYPDPSPAPFTTIAWRMAHLTGSVLVAAAALRGTRLPNGHLDERWDDLADLPSAADAAVARCDAAFDRLCTLLADATDADLERGETHEWATWQTEPDPVWRMVEYFGCFEPASHAAEIRLLRDLYRHTAGGRLDA
jgi:hypothetical protein